jgi:hypothetical protein
MEHFHVWMETIDLQGKLSRSVAQLMWTFSISGEASHCEETSNLGAVHGSHAVRGVLLLTPQVQQ